MYLQAPERQKKEGEKTICVDEKTGIQALERNAPDLPMCSGKPRRQEYEYTRHGTQCLIANWDVVEGKVISPTITETRTEEVFVKHIRDTVESDPQVTKWCFVMDNLNTHQSEALVRWIAVQEKTPIQQLGEKGKSGILKSMKTRSCFLANEQHRIRFVYTPKHCSWLNQVEIWFGILTRRLLKHGNFTSKEDLRAQIEKFIEYFNLTMAKPFKWTFNGKPLKI